jgi:hypothetical protein
MEEPLFRGVPADDAEVPTPGGWVPPARSLPGWSWLPPSGVTYDPRTAPLPLRVWLRVPVLDRFAHVWMWSRGHMRTLPPVEPGDGSAVREPRRPSPPDRHERASRRLPAR